MPDAPMFDAPMFDAPMLLVFPSLMAYAAFSDLFTMTISNWISILLVIAFVGVGLLAGMPVSTIGLHLACGFGVLVLTFSLFCFGWIGGGDAKLAATTAVWMGVEHLAEYGMGSALAGGALTLALLQFRRWPMPGWARDGFGSCGCTTRMLACPMASPWPPQASPSIPKRESSSASSADELLKKKPK